MDLSHKSAHERLEEIAQGTMLLAQALIRAADRQRAACAEFILKKAAAA